MSTPVVQLVPDYEIQKRVETRLNPLELRRFKYLFREAKENGCGVRPAIRLALRRQIEEATERLEAAFKESKNG